MSDSDGLSSPDRASDATTLPVYGDVAAEEFRQIVEDTRRPFVVRGAEIGACRHKWTPSYLRQKGAGKRVTVHWGQSRRMDFIEKNFKYVEMDFGDFVDKAQGGSPMNGEDEGKESSEKENDDGRSMSASELRLRPPSDLNAVDDIASEKRAPSDRHDSRSWGSDRPPSEWYYLRSLGSDPRRDVSDIRVGFPELAPDLELPSFVPGDDAFFSSVFRIASPGMQLWTHYDVMDNALIQIRGRKRVVLFPPSDVPYLYMKGDKSLVLDIDSPDEKRFPLMSRVTRHECFLEPGDVLFIPALWFHNVISLDFGVAVNVFWRHLPASSYDPKDVYGNRDPLLASRALQSLDRSVASLDQLPKDYRDFYLRRMILRIERKLQDL